METVQELTFSGEALLGYVLEILFQLACPIVLFVLLRRKSSRASLLPLAAGFVTYMVLSWVRALLREIILTDSVRGFPALFYLLSALLSGVLEEAGRYIAMKYPLKDRSEFEDAVSYGIGHGGCELWLAGMMQTINFLVWGLECNSKGLAAMTAGMDPERAQAFIQKLADIADNSLFGSLLMTAFGLESMLFHIAMSVLVLIAVHYEGKGFLLVCAMIMHTVADCLPPMIVWLKVPLPMTAELIIMAVPIVFTYFYWKKLTRREEGGV